MSHPDSAFSPWYSAPVGLGEDDPCHHWPSREGVGPTGRRRWMIPVDSCHRCGRILRTAGDIDWRQYSWIRRWNERANPLGGSDNG